MESKVSVHNLKKSFGKPEVLKDISIEIRKGEVVCMIDPSGSGKSTFLRYLNRLEKITSGHVVVDGHSISDPSTNINKVREDIGMVFQYFSLFPYLTMKESITLAPTGLKLMGEEEASGKVLKLLTRVGPADKAEAYPEQPSGGQKQRVTVARSLAMSPGITLSGEPTSALGPEMAGEVLEVTKQLAADGMTMVVVTHEMGFTGEVANRVVSIDEGYIMEEGTPDEVLGNPRGERTRSFLDKMLQTSGFLGG